MDVCICFWYLLYWFPMHFRYILDWYLISFSDALINIWNFFGMLFPFLRHGKGNSNQRRAGSPPQGRAVTPLICHTRSNASAGLLWNIFPILEREFNETGSNKWEPKLDGFGKPLCSPDGMNMKSKWKSKPKDILMDFWAGFYTKDMVDFKWILFRVTMKFGSHPRSTTPHGLFDVHSVYSNILSFNWGRRHGGGAI